MENPIKMDDLGVPLFLETEAQKPIFTTEFSAPQLPPVAFWCFGKWDPRIFQEKSRLVGPKNQLEMG